MLFLITALAALWMHLTVYQLLHAQAPHLSDTFERLPDHRPGPAPDPVTR